VVEIRGDLCTEGNIFGESPEKGVTTVGREKRVVPGRQIGDDDKGRKNSGR
jgi:hypothetical protein